MGSSWKNPNNELSNYNLQDNTECKNSPAVGNAWLGPEGLAWVCNQNDNCLGFVFNKGSGHGGWLVTGNWNCPTTVVSSGVKGILGQANSGLATYVKQSKTWRKADHTDTTDLSILPRDQMKTRFKAWGTSFAPDGDYKLSTGQTCCWNPQWGSGSTIGYPTCNQMDNYKVPLGWKWMITDNGIDRGDNVEGYWNRENMGWDGNTYGLDNPTNHGMTNKDDCVLAQNIGFDIPANWDTMVSKGVHPDDALAIKHNWCKANITNINDAKCTNFYSTPESSTAGYRYDQDLYYLCKDDPTWYSKSSCRTSINNAVKGTNESIRQQAKELVTSYCNTDAGRDQVDGICGCYNVTKYGGACLTTQKNIPGCKELAATIGDLPGGAQVAFSDKFCASDVCVTKALGNSTALLPDYTQGKQCPNIQQCIQDFRNANFQGSQVDASCKNTLNITGVPPPSPPAASVPPPSGTPPSALPVPALKSVLDTPKKQYAGIGCLVFLILVCCCIIILLMSSSS